MTAAAKTFSVLDRIKTLQSQMPATMGKIAAVLINDPKAPLTLSGPCDPLVIPPGESRAAATWLLATAAIDHVAPPTFYLINIKYCLPLVLMGY